MISKEQKKSNTELRKKHKFLRRIVQLVEQWFPKPKVRGSNPFFPDYLFNYFLSLKKLFCFINFFIVNFNLEISPKTKKPNKKTIIN